MSSQSWLETGQVVYIGEYGNAINPVYLWKSTDDGRSFSVASTFTGVAHVHSIYVDPYVPGRLWIAIGDVGPSPRIGYSSDRGSTFAWITKGVYPESRAVGLLFTKDAVYWATDTPEVPAGFYRWDRSTHAITRLASNTNGPWYFVAQGRRGLVQFSYIDSKQRSGYLGDEFVHVLTSTNGQRWINTRTFLKRDPKALAGDIKAGSIAVTKPDRQGRFWVYFYELQGGQGFTTNVEFRLGS